MNAKIANIANYLAALIMLGTGLICLFKNSFMPYHAEAISDEWSEEDNDFGHSCGHIIDSWVYF